MGSNGTTGLKAYDDGLLLLPPDGHESNASLTHSSCNCDSTRMRSKLFSKLLIFSFILNLFFNSYGIGRFNQELVN